MNVLWIAFAIYIIGIAVILYYRPTLMFRQEGGTWKEFGLSKKGSYTVFPFWLFTIIWAFFSYVLATMGAIFVASVARNSLPTSQVNPSYQTTPTHRPLPSLFHKTAPTQFPPQQQPGYYVFESRPSGPPKYVYFGLQPPTHTDL